MAGRIRRDPMRSAARTSPRPRNPRDARAPPRSLMYLMYLPPRPGVDGVSSDVNGPESLHGQRAQAEFGLSADGRVPGIGESCRGERCFPKEGSSRTAQGPNHLSGRHDSSLGAVGTTRPEMKSKE